MRSIVFCTWFDACLFDWASRKRRPLIFSQLFLQLGAIFISALQLGLLQADDFNLVSTAPIWSLTLNYASHWSELRSQAGISQLPTYCPCIDTFPDGWVTFEEGLLQVNISGMAFSYPSNYGLSSCIAHDEGQPPTCDALDEVPGWCTSRWCWVDKDVCTTDAEPSAYVSRVGARTLARSLSALLLTPRTPGRDSSKAPVCTTATKHAGRRTCSLTQSGIQDLGDKTRRALRQSLAPSLRWMGRTITT